MNLTVGLHILSCLTGFDKRMYSRMEYFTIVLCLGV